MSLSDRDRSILEFARLHWTHPGAKDQAVLELFGMTWPRYVQVLHSIIDTPEAEAYDPATVQRLRRLRDTRARDRSARRVGFVV